MGSKSVTLGQVRKAVKTCVLILPNDQSYFSLKTLLKYEQRFLFLKKIPANRPFPSSPGPLFQNEGRCLAFDMEIIFHSHANKTHFHKKGCAPRLILKVKVFGTRKWPIKGTTPRNFEQQGKCWQRVEEKKNVRKNMADLHASKWHPHNPLCIQGRTIWVFWCPYWIPFEQQIKNSLNILPRVHTHWPNRGHMTCNNETVSRQTSLNLHHWKKSMTSKDERTIGGNVNRWVIFISDLLTSLFVL